MKKAINCLLLAILVFGSSAMAHAQGMASFVGSVVGTKASCVIKPESIDQIITLGQVADSTLLDNNGSGKSTPHTFSIDLEMCDISGVDTVTVTFNGQAGKDGRLAINGAASGVSIGIVDVNGNSVPVGVASQPFKIHDGNNTLMFSTYLQGDGNPRSIKVGDYQAISNFTVNQ